ncbi:3-amino-5-hydroxybenzoate synthase [Parapedobacter pyrenivorans]|uniref:3-amino-5-hydroxybenzoate synthase n=1 Tax=Parapedobacter pyrenivorans TaxID=1305674 RepID=A0A917HBZ5_9SPHI|nr:DegT/DnrJ/EryC1/StrS family aminotransferase [Parapedobacter pyrenivorans]GGG73865.1 3-amino-5-hydroxybenzoate synthase [Parapedobacter pyrenivorans]
MMDDKLKRREFLKNAGMIGSGMVLAGLPTLSFSALGDGKPAVLGGTKAYTGSAISWPIYDNREGKALLDVLQSSRWGRLTGSVTQQFEREYANLLGVNHALGVSSGTAALTAIMGALDVGPGDEVIIPVYTFIATYNVVVLNHALPIFVDTDLESSQIDATKVDAAITRNTRAMMPVHLGGTPVDLDKFKEISQRTGVPIVEDACQAHMAEWRGSKVGNHGLAGAFSFQSSKNLNSGEGGAVVTNDPNFFRACTSFHHQVQEGIDKSYRDRVGTRSTNLRITEFQSSLLLAQMTRLEDQARRRHENAMYLDSMLKDIPGIVPAKLYEGTTMSAYHIFMFRYLKEHFDGLDREQFIGALAAEGLVCGRGYGPMNKSEYVQALASNKHYLKIYGKRRMKQWLESSECPQNDILVSEQAVWLMQNTLLGMRRDMEQIAEAIKRIHKYASEIKQAI